MKIFVPSILVAVLYYSCCKCDVPRNWEGFRFLDTAKKEDLVYGPNKIYNKDSIRFFYINSLGHDTTLPSRPFGISGPPNPDTVTVVAFHQSGNDTVYVDFRNGDIDTLLLSYSNTGGGCCDEMFKIVPVRYNNDSIIKKDWIIVPK